MALGPQDPSGGFQHGSVMAFINQKMAGHVEGPEFYLENISCSLVQVEDKLRAILEDGMVTSEAKEACAWASLALGVRFACKQGQLYACRIQWLQDFTKLHRSAAKALASNMKELTMQHDMECQEAAYRLQLVLAKLAEVEKEKELLRWKLLRAVRLPHLEPSHLPSLGPSPPPEHVLTLPTSLQEMRSACDWQPVTEEPGLATTSVSGAKGAGEEENKAGAAPTTTTTATGAAGGTGRHKRVERMEGAKAAEELDGGPLRLHGAVEQKTPMEAEAGRSQISGNSHALCFGDSQA